MLMQRKQQIPHRLKPVCQALGKVTLGDSRQAEPRRAPYLQSGKGYTKLPKTTPEGYRENSPALGQVGYWN